MDLQAGIVECVEEVVRKNIPLIQFQMLINFSLRSNGYP